MLIKKYTYYDSTNCYLFIEKVKMLIIINISEENEILLIENDIPPHKNNKDPNDLIKEEEIEVSNTFIDKCYKYLITKNELSKLLSNENNIFSIHEILQHKMKKANYHYHQYNDNSSNICLQLYLECLSIINKCLQTTSLNENEN